VAGLCPGDFFFSVLRLPVPIRSCLWSHIGPKTPAHRPSTALFLFFWLIRPSCGSPFRLVPRQPGFRVSVFPSASSLTAVFALVAAFVLAHPRFLVFVTFRFFSPPVEAFSDWRLPRPSRSLPCQLPHFCLPVLCSQPVRWRVFLCAVCPFFFPPFWVGCFAFSPRLALPCRPRTWVFDQGVGCFLQ